MSYVRIKDLNRRQIVRLMLMQPTDASAERVLTEWLKLEKTCEGCKHKGGDIWSSPCYGCTHTNYNDCYERKGE